MDERHHKSQYGQGKIIEKLCYPKGDETHVGIFIEVGAWDGVDISNTYQLEKMHDWKGVLVEPIYTRAESARHNRWCEVFQGLVLDREGTAAFTYIKGYSEMLSGSEADYHPTYALRVKKEIRDHNQQVERQQLPCKTLNGLMETYKLSRADYLSLDVQSAELKVLQAYEVDTHPIKCISLDTNGINTDEISNWFQAHGYELHWKHGSSDEYFYIHPELSWSWERVPPRAAGS